MIEFNPEHFDVTPTQYLLQCMRCRFSITGSKSLVEAAIDEHNERNHQEES